MTDPPDPIPKLGFASEISKSAKTESGRLFAVSSCSATSTTDTLACPTAKEGMWHRSREELMYSVWVRNNKALPSCMRHEASTGKKPPTNLTSEPPVDATVEGTAYIKMVGECSVNGNEFAETNEESALDTVNVTEPPCCIGEVHESIVLVVN
jgi:hypothetical protein